VREATLLYEFHECECSLAGPGIDTSRTTMSDEFRRGGLKTRFWIRDRRLVDLVVAVIFARLFLILF
jgi:hypothetical protein